MLVLLLVLLLAFSASAASAAARMSCCSFCIACRHRLKGLDEEYVKKGTHGEMFLAETCK